VWNFERKALRTGVVMEVSFPGSLLIAWRRQLPKRAPGKSVRILFVVLSKPSVRIPFGQDPVELKNSAESGRVAIVIAQEATEALATPHRTAVTPQAWLGCDELIGEALMIALGMIVGQVLVDHS
jgi:hypothetical protein